MNGAELPKRWEYWLYPTLGKFELEDRSRALANAKEVSFDAIEVIGIGVALVLVIALTRYSTAHLGFIARVGAAFANFVVAVPLLLVFAGPFYVRRVRRGLREQLDSRSREGPGRAPEQ